MTIVVRTRLDAAPAGPAYAWRDRLAVLRQSWRVLAMAAILTFGPQGGLLIVEEAAAVGAAVTFVFAFFSRFLGWPEFKRVLIQAAISTATIRTGASKIASYSREREQQKRAANSIPYDLTVFLTVCEFNWAENNNKISRLHAQDMMEWE